MKTLIEEKISLNGSSKAGHSDTLCPVDRRIQDFLNDYLKDVSPVELPRSTFVLDRAGLARELSLPENQDHFSSDIVDTYRVSQGVLHNPKNDRRTTQGVFHIAMGGLAIPDDKLAVPKAVFAKLLAHALTPPADLMVLPYTSAKKNPSHVLVSLLMRPIVSPAAGKTSHSKSMEIRFFAPGNLVGNLDFVETIFGNGGDPYLPENDAALDTDHWTGHSGCVILAPHLTKLKKKDLGLPPFEKATERENRDGMCWKDADELYNGGQAFKITCRDARGVMVTVIADNYFGYCKKEVKTQISFSANLFGLCEEEHSGGAIAFPSYILGQDFFDDGLIPLAKRTFDDTIKTCGESIDVKSDGYAVDKKYPSIIYVPETARFNVRQHCITWTKDGREIKKKLLAHEVYVLPSGYKVHMERQIGGPSWRLIGTSAEGTLCHKPCTVSGGGKSEISKSIAYSMLSGPVFVKDFHSDLDLVEQILKKDFATIYKNPTQDKRSSRPVLSPERSLGSVIKLFTPSSEYTDDHNTWLSTLPQTIRQLLLVIKRYYRPEWGENWREHFSVDRINGHLAHELRYDDQRLVAHYLRVGHDEAGSWRIFKVRPDFNPAVKVQVEDDITASIVVPKEALSHLDSSYENNSVKLVTNCERFLFQRPDDAIYRGYDHQAEADLASPNTFLSNWEPLQRTDVQDIIENIVDFEQYTEPMRTLLSDFLNGKSPDYVVSSAHPRMVGGKPSKNPRYLQKRPDHVNVRATYLSEVGARLARGVPPDYNVYFPVNSVLAGRRNNPADPEAGIPPLAVYNPIHFQDLPELFMDFVSSLTGKSPSTTGFGSEGALTKGPFNALWPVVDLNNALVSMILTEYDGFTTAAGYIGPNVKVDHDISLLIPEIWCRMKVQERKASYLIENGYMEKIGDFQHQGRLVLGSRLGYRITGKFVDRFLGRLFETPNAVFTEDILKPERQSFDNFAEGIENIVITQKRVAEYYFKDGSVDAACPPLKALLHIMVRGHFEGKDVNHPDIRALFTREAVIKSAWYRERLVTKQKRDIALWKRHVTTLEANASVLSKLRGEHRLDAAKKMLQHVQTPAYLEQLVGTIGADPFHLQ